MAHVQGVNGQAMVATVWHPEASGDVIDCGSNNVRVLVGDAAYQLTTGEMVKV